MVKHALVSLNMLEKLSFCRPAAAPIGAMRCLPAGPRPAFCGRIGKMGFRDHFRPLLGRVIGAKSAGCIIGDMSAVGIASCPETSGLWAKEPFGAAPRGPIAPRPVRQGTKPEETGKDLGFVMDAGAFITKALPGSRGRADAVVTVNRGRLPLATLRKELPSHAFYLLDCPEPAARAGHRLRLFRSTGAGLKELPGRA